MMLSKRVSMALVFGIIAVLSVAGCTKEKEEKEEGSRPSMMKQLGPMQEGGSTEMAQHPTGKVKRRIVVPDEVKETWKTIKVKVRDKKGGSEKVMEVEVGKVIPVEGTPISVKVEAFLPDYVMYEDVISSKSNKPVNPAAMVEVFEGGESIARGWVFSRFPSFNSYRHERYEIILLTEEAKE